MATDHELGLRISKQLEEQGIETPIDSNMSIDRSRDILLEACRKLVIGTTLDTNDDSISGTPARLYKMYAHEIFYGLDYRNFPACTVIENKMGYDEMILVKNIEVLSLCEHHFVPFIGKAHIAYLPKTKVLGLSKFNRVTDFFSRRPQVQERLTAQIHSALSLILETDNVAVVIEAEHLCVKLRGVKDDSETTTAKMDGRFMESPALRSEFYAAINGRK